MLARRLPLLAASALAACLAERRPMPARDDRLAREIARQVRWAGEAVAGRPSAEELSRARDGDADAVSDARKRLRRLLTAAERAIWIRDAAAPALRDAGDDTFAVDGIVRDFEKSGRLRDEAFAAAGETAQSLADSRGKSAIALADLRQGLLLAQSADETEKRLARELDRSRASDARDRGAQGALALQRLTTLPAPSSRPFVSAAARYLERHPDEERQLDSFPSSLADERAQIRAALAELRRAEAEAPRRTEGAPAGAAAPESKKPAPSTPPSDSKPEGRASIPIGQLEIAADARKLIERRGSPTAFAARPDSLFALRYVEKRPCGDAKCDTIVDYLFDAQGKLVREEVVEQRQ